MILNLSQSKIYSSLNFREALQPQSVNKFTLDVCTPSRLLTQSHKFCTQRAEAQALHATQSFPKREKLIIGSEFAPLCTPLKDKYLCALCSLRKNLESSQMTWIEGYDYCKYLQKGRYLYT